MPWSLFRKAKVNPISSSVEEEEHDERTEEFSMHVVKLHTLLKVYGGQRHPEIESYDVWKERGDLKEYRYVPPDSTTIYISHEWAGTDRPDPDGTQMYNLLLLLERLQNGEVHRTDMDFFHSLIYKQNYTTKAKEWKRILNPEKTYIWYDGFCVPRSRREDGFRSIPSYMRRCDLMIILAPGCTHFDRIDPRTQRKMHLCYRTYRLRASCVFELFSSFLSTKVGQVTLMPTLLVRGGTEAPNWISAFTCQSLAVGHSRSQCCETNHRSVKRCRKYAWLKSLRSMIKSRVECLFREKNILEARFTACFKHWWLRGLASDSKICTVEKFQTEFLRWQSDVDGNNWNDRDGISVLMYACLGNQIDVIRDILSTMDRITDSRTKTEHLKSKTPKPGFISLGLTAGMTSLHMAMIFANPDVVAILLEHGTNPYEKDCDGFDAFLFACMFSYECDFFLSIYHISLSLCGLLFQFYSLYLAQLPTLNKQVHLQESIMQNSGFHAS